MDDVDELVDKYTRKELNEIAEEEGVKSPKSLPNKEAVAEKIVKAREADKYTKKPVGLYIKDE